jgi:hypothetical protein
LSDLDSRPGFPVGDGSQVRHVPYHEVVHHRVPDGLDQDHPGQPNAPGREALSQLAKREVDVPHLKLYELDVADQLDQVPDHDPVARHGGFCLRVQGLEPVLQALLDGVIGGDADACGEFLMLGAQLVFDLGLGPSANGDPVSAAVWLPADRDCPGPAVSAPVVIDRVFAPGATLGL